MNLKEVAAEAGEHSGVLWSLNKEQSEDLNANLVRFPTGGGVGEHINDEVDLVIVGVSGSGEILVGEERHDIRSGMLVFVPKGARRSILSGSDDFAYLSIHRRRTPLPIERLSRRRSRTSKSQ